MLTGRARSRRILGFFTRLFATVLIWDIGLRKVGLTSIAEKNAEKRYIAIARDFRTLALELGGVLIKVGQFLSSRVDVLPEYLTDELKGLQDEVPAVPFPAIEARLIDELGPDWRQRFRSFDETTLAAASLGQTYRATLPTGERVIVKVQRPDIDALVEIDLDALTRVATWAMRYKAVSRRVDAPALLHEFAGVLRQELDYVNEAANAERFAELLSDDPRVRIPKAYPERGTDRVLVLQDVGYLKITDYEAIDAAGIDRADVADRLLKTYLHQIIDFQFFHADPHPGNLFVQPSTADNDWRLVFVDFGMVGVVTPEVRDAIRNGIIAVGTQDAARLIKAITSVNILLPDADTERFTEAVQAVFDRFWGKTMDELRNVPPAEIHAFVDEFRDLLYDSPIQLPENLIYLGRTVAILSGMCTGLYPDFNLFRALTPFVNDLLAEETRGRNAQYWISEVGDQLRRIAALPSRVDTLVSRIDRVNANLPAARGRGGRVGRRSGMADAVVAVGLITAGTVLFIVAQPVPAIVAWVASGFVWILSRLR